MIKKTLTTTFITTILPAISLAQGSAPLSSHTFETLIYEVLGVINMLLPLLTAAAFIFFFWGLSKFILNSDSKENVEKGKNYMLWGILVLFILLSYRSIILVLGNEIGLGTTDVIPLLKTN